MMGVHGNVENVSKYPILSIHIYFIKFTVVKFHIIMINKTWNSWEYNGSSAKSVIKPLTLKEV
jgi:hypothetical protein